MSFSLSGGAAGVACVAAGRTRITSVLEKKERNRLAYFSIFRAPKETDGDAHLSASPAPCRTQLLRNASRSCCIVVVVH